MARVLVTGGSGFVGSHCLLALLAAGHEVRTTVRHPERERAVRAMLQAAGAAPAGQLAFVTADLERDDGWAAAMAGCDYVLHVASPFPSHVPADENELLVPAREGTRRVLKAARDAGVSRVVLTSSFAAVGYGHPPRATPFDETDWTNPEAEEAGPYVKSKTLAERAAWDFIEREGAGLELAVVNPVGIFGPVLGPDFSTSILLIQRFMKGAVPGCPPLWFGVVDVRDVADLHLRAMVSPHASGERFLCVAGDFMSLVEIAQALKLRLGPLAKRVPTRRVPGWLLRVVALWDPTVRQVLPELGKQRNATSAKAGRLLGWQPRPREEALVSTARSLLDLGLLDA